MITVTALAKSFASQVLFDNVSVQLNPGCRYGLVGPNGSGKTTFLNIITGDEEPSAGTVAMPRRLEPGVLRQDHYRWEDVAILDVVMMGHGQLWQAIQEKEKLLAADAFDGERYAEVEDIILSNEGYSFEARAGEILEGLGIATEFHRQNLSTLSGGFKLRALLAQVLAAHPQCLLLDEPTNHLDIISIRWLEKFLLSYSGCAMVISHDHRFLDNVCSHILDIDYQTITLYTGNYTAFTTGKRTERERKEAEIAKRERQIADHQAFIDRFRAKATKARQAQSKVKQMERIVIQSLPGSSRRYPTFAFKQCRPTGKEVLEITGISKAFADNQVLNGVSLNLRRGDRLAIIGPNGIGKSTLLKIITGSLEADSGTLKWGHETYPGYFAQDHHEILGASTATVEGWLGETCAGQGIGFVRGQLAKVLFSGEDAEKKVKSLSGGEAARLIFSRMVVERPNVLVLDEPTNHLDLEAIEALVAGLAAFDGTLIFVSHDRWFVSHLANRIIEITAQGLNDFRGTYAEYLERCGDDHLDADAVLRVRRKRRKAGPEQPGQDASRKQRERELKKLRQRQDELTAEIERVETRTAEIDELFCDPGFFKRTSPREVARLQMQQRDLSTEGTQLTAEWEQVEEQMGELEAANQATAL